MRSAPFDPPERGRVAVKIVTATGMEMTTVCELIGSYSSPPPRTTNNRKTAQRAT